MFLELISESVLRDMLSIDDKTLFELIKRLFDYNYKITYVVIILLVISIITSGVTFWNQRKIKKMLRKLIEAQEARVEPGGEEPKEEP